MDRNDSNIAPSPPDPYREGMRLYRQGFYSRAVEALSKVFHAQGLVGTVARYYHGMSCRALGALALAQGKTGEAERHLAAAAQSLGKAGRPAELPGLPVRSHRPRRRLRPPDRKGDGHRRR